MANDGDAYPEELWNPPSDGQVNPDIDLDEVDPSGRAGRVAGRRRGRSGRARPASRRRKILKWTALGTAGLVAVVAGLGTYVVLHLDGNIKHTALLPTGVTQASETPDKFGNTAMNILLIGTDARVSAADCSLGGDCSSSGDGNSDVMMVIHLSADRTNSTIMSIPRDTMTQIPACGSNSSYYGMVNSSLQYGASCTVATVHQLTGLTIDHYMEVDFSGVVAMSDALGGVPVCVSNTMYDKDSGLRLNAGTTVVEGKQALEFVRTRHGFYDGSDLGREKAQHIFLSDMIRQLRSEASLTDLGNLYSIANAATKSLQVDDGLAGVTNLISLFDTMNKVPTDRVTFVTMPWELDPANTERVIPEQAQAEQMFTNIKDDVSYSSAKSSDSSTTSSKTATATATATAGSASNVVTSEVHAQILNGTGVSGRASDLTQALVSAGFSSGDLSTGNASSTAKTVVYYPSGRADSAAAVADALGIPSSQVVESSSYSEVTVVVGTDWTSGTTYPASASGASSAATTAASAPSESSALNAATTGQCVQVAPDDIVN
ncbi:LCP family protein [Actinospica durhamensis]|uniref:LCP family protein n=1 Tax=Actinospica durhamensis TaxID=1508375 RepID=A0A941EG47_9ACTN|nr:LCP family protein [Actinospica durhamensis]MBR7832010.1 LCP family protein [Actinospica durhamensis]